MESLVAKACGLRLQGISTWLYTGSYRLPSTTVTGDVMKDIMMIEPIIGAGELAISDHRSSRPALAELGRIVSEARVGGLLVELVAAGDIPRTQFMPTHCNRNPALFDESLLWAAAGGWADLTTSTVPSFIAEGEVTVPEALRRFAEKGLIDRVTCSSDGQGSLPLFDGNGVLLGLTMGSSSSLWNAVREAIFEAKVPLEEAAKTITANPARALKLAGKGRLAVGADADILILDAAGLEVRGLISGGRTMMAAGEVLAKGAFEL